MTPSYKQRDPINEQPKNLFFIDCIEVQPEVASLPLLDYKFYQALSKLVDVTLIAHERNKTPLSKLKEHPNITYIAESARQKYILSLVAILIMKGKSNDSLANVLGYRVNEEFKK